MRASRILTTLAFLYTVPVNGEFQSGRKLLETCGPEPFRYYCLGYVAGSADAASPDLCLPSDVALEELVQRFKAYANEKPNELEMPATHLIRSALRDAFPCGKL